MPPGTTAILSVFQSRFRIYEMGSWENALGTTQPLWPTEMAKSDEPGGIAIPTSLLK